MIIPNSDLILAEALAGPNPLGYKLRPDGTLCVIDSKGRKLVFTPAQVAQAGAKIAAAQKAPAPSAGKPAPVPAKNNQALKPEPVEPIHRGTSNPPGRQPETSKKCPTDKPLLSGKPVASTATGNQMVSKGGKINHTEEHKASK